MFNTEYERTLESASLILITKHAFNMVLGLIQKLLLSFLFPYVELIIILCFSIFFIFVKFHFVK